MSTKKKTETVEEDELFEWHNQQELILKQWSEIGASYRYLHDRSFLKFNSQNMGFAIPIIVISTVTGTANFAQGSFPVSAQPYVPAIIGFFNLLAGLLTTIAQFLRVSELLEGHRAASIAYSKFSRNIAVELSLPVSQRSMSGLDFINKCRTELDRLIEQSPGIPEYIVKKFGKRFENHEFIKPDILDIRSVEIYIQDEAQERLKRAQIIAEEEKKKEALITKELQKRDSILQEFMQQQKEKKLEFRTLLQKKKEDKKNHRSVHSVTKSMEGLMSALGGARQNLDSKYKDILSSETDTAVEISEVEDTDTSGNNQGNSIVFNATPMINTGILDDSSSSSSDDANEHTENTNNETNNDDENNTN
jgi:hypothetical protein